MSHLGFYHVQNNDFSILILTIILFTMILFTEKMSKGQKKKKKGKKYQDKTLTEEDKKEQVCKVICDQYNFQAVSVII